MINIRMQGSKLVIEVETKPTAAAPVAKPGPKPAAKPGPKPGPKPSAA